MGRFLRAIVLLGLFGANFALSAMSVKHAQKLELPRSILDRSLTGEAAERLVSFAKEVEESCIHDNSELLFIFDTINTSGKKPLKRKNHRTEIVARFLEQYGMSYDRIHHALLPSNGVYKETVELELVCIPKGN
ncbi:MAG: hypothetical protein WBD34_14310 [Burkholderiaceae bacterium]